MAKKYHEDHFSPRVADLMSALTLIFLFISVVYMLQVNKEKERIEMIAKDFKNTKYETASTSRHEFGEVYSEDGEDFIKLNLQVRFR